MHIYNKTILVYDLNEIVDLLNNKKYNEYNCKGIYENRIAIQHRKDENNKDYRNIINIWRTTSIFNYWYTLYENCSKNFICCFDYTIHDSFIKINHLGINDGYHRYLYNNPLDGDDSEDLIKACINFIKIVAKNENKNKIIIDLHSNLRLYEKYYHYEGFKMTNRKCNNPYWLEAEINL